MDRSFGNMRKIFTSLHIVTVGLRFGLQTEDGELVICDAMPKETAWGTRQVEEAKASCNVNRMRKAF